MEQETSQTENIYAVEQQPEPAFEQKPKNKNLMLALIIGGVALFIIIALVLVILLSGGGKAGSGSAHEFVPNAPATLINYDIDANLGDLTNSVIPLISQTPQLQSPEAQDILRNLPNLEFLQCSGFVLMNNDRPGDSLLGFRLSGRGGNPQNHYRAFIEKIGGIKGLKAELGADGFASIGSELAPLLYTYLDESFLLAGGSRESIAYALDVKSGKIPSVAKHPKWQRIKDKLGRSPFSFFTNFRIDEKEYTVTGTVATKTGELGFEVSWLDGAREASGLLPKNESIPNLGDILKWQKNLGKLISLTPDSTIKMAIPFTFGLDNRIIEGESVGFVKLNQLLEPDIVSIRMKGDKDKMMAFVEKSIIGEDKISKLLPGGIIEVTKKPKVVAVPKKTVPKNLKPAEPPVNEPVNPPVTGRSDPSEYVPSPSIFGNEMDTFYIKAEGDILTIANKWEGLTWVSGKNENVSGTILTAIIDGKLIFSSLLEKAISGGEGSMPDMGMNLLMFGTMLDSLDPKLHIDLAGQGDDLMLKITVKYNQDFLTR